MAKPLTRAASGIGAVALATGAFLAMAPQAYAGQISANVTCDVPMVGKKTAQQTIKVDAPATGAAGADVTVTVTLGPSPATSPVPLSNIDATPSIDFKVGSSTVTVTGAPVKVNFEANKPITSPPYTGKFKIPAGATGKIDLIPVKMATVADVSGQKLTTPCTVEGATSVASITIGGSSSTTTSGGSSTTTSGGSSTTSSGGSTSTSGGTTAAAGSSTTTTGDSLPKTGPLDDALSMGLVGGTVGLLGIGAVLVATRKVRNSRNAAA
ncbi:hypothetical protein GCM10023205_30350 [Yinghuangia aomiensis]|uniref:LPXTG-motif cell wall anchor domain-containing protein n=1 Tax=Yinghuangia aomiensis TaxID=676205 RepID=A0ABP9H8R8_9ACTN